MATTVLYVDAAGRKPLPDASILRVAAASAEISCVTDLQTALMALRSLPHLDILVTNTPDLALLELAKTQHPGAHTVLVTEDTMESYSAALHGQEDILIGHVIANHTPTAWTVNELRVTVQKLLRKDLFGIEKYLASGTPQVERPVTGSADRDRLNSLVMTFAEDNRLGQYTSKLVFGITEELLMNAIYDAPVAGGKLHYAELPRTSPISLQPDEYGKLTFGCDGSVFAISVADPFGALKREKLFQYLKKVLRRSDSANLIDTKKGGAGLGLFKILYSSHALICNVDPGRRTEVIALIDIQHQVRDFSKMARSVHYFATE
ncbi:MAG: hypothetical protein NTZ90_17805 [Proteobacteria bacterium]|nr:hypothetical protein [Pseudomonadota bacterium]